MSLLEVRDLCVSYGQVEAVRGISLEVNAGEVVALIGANGAGKSSVLNALAGLVPARGSVNLDGHELLRRPSHVRVSLGLALVPEGRAILQQMTVHENLLLAAEGRPAAAEAVAAQLRRFPSLQGREQAPAGALSGGEQQMLAMARALLLQPRILLLDEPSMGLSPILVRQIFETVREIHAAGTTVLLVEQNARMALQVAHKAYVLERGRIALAGDAAALAADARVQAAYLGG